jgi:hypothetical protein
MQTESISSLALSSINVDVHLHFDAPFAQPVQGPSRAPMLPKSTYSYPIFKPGRALMDPSVGWQEI